MKKNNVLPFILIFSILFPFAGFADIKGVRIAHYLAEDISSIPNEFLEYARKNGYNYLLAHGNNIMASSGASDWRNPVSPHNVDGSYDMAWAKTPKNISLYSKLKDLFQRADRYGLKVIPCFNMTSSHGGHWVATNTKIKLNTGIDDAGNSYSIPVLIEDAEGMDKSFLSYLRVVKIAFFDAGVSYSQLDYIHIGHDEIVAKDNKIIIGRWNTDEQNWIKNHGNNDSAYYQLMASEVVRRVITIKSAFPGTKTIIWADAWDPEWTGGYNISAWKNGGWINNLQTKKVTEQTELSTIKNDLVLMPWMYIPSPTPGDDYASDVTLQFFKDNGFKVIVGVALNDFPGYPPEESRIMNKEWVNISKDTRFKDVVIGCCCHTFWDDGRYWNSIPRPIRFQILPEFAKEANFFPNIQPYRSDFR